MLRVACSVWVGGRVGGDCAPYRDPCLVFRWVRGNVFRVTCSVWVGGRVGGDCAPYRDPCLVFRWVRGNVFRVTCSVWVIEERGYVIPCVRVYHVPWHVFRWTILKTEHATSIIQQREHFRAEIPKCTENIRLVLRRFFCRGIRERVSIGDG